jgi:hypothetical protein
MNDNHIADDDAVTRGPNDAAIAPRADADTAGAKPMTFQEWHMSQGKTGYLNSELIWDTAYAAGASNERASVSDRTMAEEWLVKMGLRNSVNEDQVQTLEAFCGFVREHDRIVAGRADAEKDAALGDIKILEIADRFNFSGINDEIIDFARAILAAIKNKENNP